MHPPPHARWFSVEIEELALGFLYARREHWDSVSWRSRGYHTALRMGIILPSPDRFWSQVEQTEGDGCWKWKGPLHKNGYGITAVPGIKTHWAHRIAYTFAFGPIARTGRRHDTCVCHRCDNPPCVRPDHLFLGSAADNMRDRDMKGRGRSGPNAPHRRATAA